MAAIAGALAGSSPGTAADMQPFTTDGCSLFPDRSVLGTKDWCSCCLAHDLAYWRGGTRAERLNADRLLRTCVEKKTRDHALAELMYLGVRAGGGPGLQTSFRWGYGWPHGRGYKALSATEKEQAKALEGLYLQQNPDLQCRSSTERQNLPSGLLPAPILRLPERVAGPTPGGIAAD